MKVQILIDNPNSWIIPYAKKLISKIEKKIDSKVNLIFSHENVLSGDILILLSCEKIFKKLNLNKYNLVVHESDLPKGKGWSPMTWQILEGLNKIVISLFEASPSVDSGQIYEKVIVELKGHELIDEIRKLQAKATLELILNFIDNYPNINHFDQNGDESFYPKRTKKDSELNVSKTIKEQFNLLRVCDNEIYPAFFYINEKKYIIKIYKDDQ
jgi:methionyl-tRNA formyltransferase